MSVVAKRLLRSAACVLALAIALAARGALAVELFQWVDAEGVISIGPNPPPGVSAIPYAPVRANAPTPASALIAPTAASPATPAAPTRTGGPAEVSCATYADTARKAASDLEQAESEAARLEAKLEALDQSNLAYARTECVARDSAGPDPDCRATTFDRDKEISRTEKALDAAQDKLADAEARVGEAAIPPRCEPASAD